MPARDELRCINSRAIAAPLAGLCLSISVTVHVGAMLVDPLQKPPPLRFSPFLARPVWT
jgi:hypothetical protein